MKFTIEITQEHIDAAIIETEVCPGLVALRELIGDYVFEVNRVGEYFDVIYDDSNIEIRPDKSYLAYSRRYFRAKETMPRRMKLECFDVDAMPFQAIEAIQGHEASIRDRDLSADF